MPYETIFLKTETTRCLMCHDTPCSEACPKGLPVGDIMIALRFDHFHGAARRIGEENPCMGCEAPCMSKCRRGLIDKAIDIPEVVAEVAEEGPQTLQVGETTIVRLVEQNDSDLQKDELAPVIEEEIKDVEILPGVPDFTGGYLALARWLDKNVEYPKEAVSGKVQGDVVVSVIIDELGRVNSPQVTQSAHPLLDAAALKVVSKMPQWRWREDGTLHKARINIPISFHTE